MIKNKALIVIITILLLNSCSFFSNRDKTEKNNCNIEWSKTCNTDSTIVLKTIKRTSDKGYLLAGYQNTNFINLVKLDKDGNKLWENVYTDTSNNLYISNAFPTSYGDIVVTARAFYEDTIWGYLWIVPYIIYYDETGNIKWTKMIVTYPSDYTWDMKSSNFKEDGSHLSITFNDNFIYEFNKNGDSINMIQKDSIVSLEYCLNTQDGGFINFGNQEINSKRNIYIEKYNSLYNLQWSKHLGGYFNDVVFSMSEIDNTYFVTGYTESFSNGGKDIYIINIDRDGNIIWERNYGTEYDEVGIKTSQFNDNSYKIIGESINSNELLLLDIDRNGNVIGEGLCSIPAIDHHNIFQYIFKSGERSLILFLHNKHNVPTDNIPLIKISW